MLCNTATFLHMCSHTYTRMHTQTNLSEEKIASHTQILQ